MARYTVAKLFLFTAALLGAGDETSGDDEASVVLLTMGRAASHAPSWHPQMPFGGHLGGRVEMRVDRVRDRAMKNREAT
jgi:hypothetical protein